MLVDLNERRECVCPRWFEWDLGLSSGLIVHKKNSKVDSQISYNRKTHPAVNLLNFVASSYLAI